MALSTPNVPAVDMNAQRRFQRDIVDTMYTAVTESRHVSFLVQSFANLLNLGESRIRAVVRSTEERFSFFAFVDSYQGPSEVVVNRSSLARVPDSANDGVSFVLWHLEKIHGEPVFAGSESLSRDGRGRTHESLKDGFEMQKDFGLRRISFDNAIYILNELLKNVPFTLHGLQPSRRAIIDYSCDLRPTNTSNNERVRLRLAGYP